MERKSKAAAESGILLFVIVGIVVALNALSFFGGYARVDTTKTEKYKLSKGSANLIRSMKKDKMVIDAYVTKGLPKLDAFVRDLRDLLLEYQAQSGGKLEFRMIEPKEEKDKEKAKEAGCVAQPFGEANQDEEKAMVAQGYMCLVLNYGTERDAIKFLPPERTDGLEFWITNKIRELRDKGDGIKHKLGLMVGHDEIKLSDANLVPSNMGKASMQQILGQNFSFYTFQDVDLKGGESEIDDGLDGLIITQPAKDYTEKELRRIDQFVMKGKSLAIFASAVNIKANDPSMNASLSTHGLEKLLDGYGIELRKDVILDFGRKLRIPLPTQGGMVVAEFPQVLDVRDDPYFVGNEQLLDTSFAPFFRIQQLSVPFASSLILHDEKQPNAKPRVVMRSSPRTVRQTTDSVDLSIHAWRPKGEWQQYAMSATLEGKIKSAFPTGEKQGVEAPAESAKESRVFLLASAQFLANPFARAGNAPEMNPQMQQMMPQGGGDEKLLFIAGQYAQATLTNTILSLKNTLDWCTGDTELLAASAKLLSDPPLAFGETSKPNFADESDEQLKKREEDMKQSRKKTQTWVQIVLMAFLPLAVAAFGLMRWQMRQRSRESISLA